MHISWVGNSFVYFNDLPTMLASMLVTLPLHDAADGGVTHSQVTPGGQRLVQHAEDERVAALLQQPATHVVLQDHSCAPGRERNRQQTEAVLQAFFSERIAATTNVLVYATWGNALGCVYESYKADYPDFSTMQEKITAGCERYASVLGPRARLVPVGDAFRFIFDEDRSAGRDPLDESSLFRRLYAPDNFHPSRLGSYLAACTFAYQLTAQSPVGSAFRPAARCVHDDQMIAELGEEWEPREMSDNDAARLQLAAAAAVDAQASKATT